MSDDWRTSYDWQEAFGYASNIRHNPAVTAAETPFTMDDVAEVIAMSEGENDGPSWIMAGKLKDGRYFFLSAGCDYTGWDCQAGGDAMVASTKDELFRLVLTNDDRERLGISL